MNEKSSMQMRRCVDASMRFPHSTRGASRRLDASTPRRLASMRRCVLAFFRRLDAKSVEASPIVVEKTPRRQKNASRRRGVAAP